MTDETWRVVADYPDYEVSDFGRVRRAIKGKRNHACRVLKPWLNNKGYQMVCLVKDSSARKFLVSRLVCTAFHGSAPSPMHEVAHSNGNQKNNHKDNQRWATRAENMADSLMHGTFCMGDAHWTRKHPERRTVGEAHGRAKLTEIDVLEIRSLNAKSCTGREIARRFGISPAAVSLICSRKNWAHI